MTTATTSPKAGERLRRNWPWFASVVVVLVTAGILVGSTLDDEALSATPGDVVYTSFQLPKGYASSVRLPFGTLSVALTKPLTTVPDDENMDGREAPDEGSFVGIATKVSDVANPPSVGDAATVATHIELIVGAQHYPIPHNPLAVTSDYYSAGAQTGAWVAVDGVPDDVRVGFEYDGVTQVLDPRKGTRDTGRAAALYADPDSSSRKAKRCGASQLSAGFSMAEPGYRPRCRIDYLRRVPYVSGLGWPPKGRSWLAVAADVDRFVYVAWHHSAANYRAVITDNTPMVTLGAAKTAGEPEQNRISAVTTSGATGLTGFFPVPDHLASGQTVHVSIAFSKLLRVSGSSVAGAPFAPDVRISWQVPVS